MNNNAVKLIKAAALKNWGLKLTMLQAYELGKKLTNRQTARDTLIQIQKGEYKC